MSIRISTRFLFVAPLVLALVCGVVAVTAAQNATPVDSSPVVAESIEFLGEMAQPGAVTIADLQTLPTESVDVTYIDDAGQETQRNYVGVRLWDVLQLVQPNIDPADTESPLPMYLVLRAADGYTVVISMGEIHPDLGDQPYLLAWEEDGHMLSAEQQPLLLAVPGDRTEGRYIFGIVSIDVRNANSD